MAPKQIVTLSPWHIWMLVLSRIACVFRYGHRASCDYRVASTRNKNERTHNSWKLCTEQHDAGTKIVTCSRNKDSGLIETDILCTESQPAVNCQPAYRWKNYQSKSCKRNRNRAHPRTNEDVQIMIALHHLRITKSI